MPVRTSVPLARLRCIPAAAFLLTLPAWAQPAAEHQLPAVTVIDNGEEHIEATGSAVVTAEDLQRLQPKDLVTVFQRESGVAVTGGAQAAQRVHVQGFEQSFLNVTVDGARQPGTAWHHAGSLALDPSFLKRVEVEAGAAAADAGFGSAVGALRYETVNALDLLRPGQTAGGRIQLGYGSNGQGFTTNLSTYGKQGTVDWLVMGSRQNGTDYDDARGRTAVGTAPKQSGGLAKLGLQLPQGDRVELSLEHNRDDAQRLVRMNMDTVRGKDQETARMDLRRNTVTLKYTTTEPTATWDPLVQVWYNDVDFARPNFNPKKADGNYTSDTTGYGFKAQNMFKVGKGKLTAGVDGSRSNLTLHAYPTLTTTARQVNEHDQQLGLYTQLRMNLASGLSLSTGARYDWHELHAQDGKVSKDGGWSANGTLSYLLGEHAEAYVGLSRTFLGYQWGTVGLYHARPYATATDYQASHATNKKLGVNFFGDQWRLGIGYFDTKLLDRTELRYLSASQGLRANRSNDLRSQGWSLSAAYHGARTQVGLNLTLADVREGRGTDVLLPEGGDAMPVGNTATLYADHHIPAWNTRLGTNLRIAQKEKFSDLAKGQGYLEQPTYAVVGAYAEWQPYANDQLTLRLGVDNLFDRKYYTRSSYPVTVSGISPMSAPGRSVALSGTWKF